MAICVNEWDVSAGEKGYRHYMQILTRCMFGREQDLLGIFWVIA